ncbi:MAG: hypothetical protein OXF68_16765 [Gammaproteobacteria bacterium]|nr:hypothetical protein [Gammaproteobacteria bacterium]
MGRLQAQLKAAVDDRGLASTARALDMPIGQVRSLVAGRSATAKTIERAAEGLGWEFYVGPPRGGAADAPRDDSGRFAAPPDAPSAAPDPDLSALSSALERHWRALGGAYARRIWLAHLRRQFPELSPP